jgi:hypothetical protein
MPQASRARVWHGIAVLAIACLFAVVPARASADVPSAVQQYVETVPTGAGSQVAGTTAAAVALSPQVEQALLLEGGADATALHQIASTDINGATQTAADVAGGADTLALEIGALMLAASLLAITGWRFRHQAAHSIVHNGVGRR